MTAKRANPIDVHVGQRVRLRRMLVGMSQEKLGELLGVTFQQVQKYEKGVNRIGASRLFDVSRVLEVPVQYFYDDMPGAARAGAPGFGEADQTAFVMDFVSSAEGLELTRAFTRVRDPKVRRRIIELVRTLAGDPQDA